MVAFSALAVVLRLALSMARSRGIPAMLRAGRVNLLSRSALVVGDSELSSHVVTESQLAWKRRPPSANYLLLCLRRLLRRPHLLLTLAALLLSAWVTMPTLEPYTVYMFLLVWALLGAEVARCADFSRVRGPR